MNIFDRKKDSSDVEKKKIHRQLRYLPSNIVLEEISAVPLVISTIAVISGIVILLIIWAALTNVKETAITFGEIIPSGEVQVIQHLEGGIIEKVLIDDGATVKKGQLLVQLSSAQAYADLQQLRSRELALLLDAARLKAFINDQTPDVDEWKQVILQSKYFNGTNQADIDSLLADEKQQLALQAKSMANQRDILSEQLKQKQDELTKIQKQQDEATTQLSLLNKEKKMYDDLGKDSPISQRDYLSILREINTTEGTLNQIPAQLQQANAAISETQNRLNEVGSGLKESASKDLGDVQSQLDQVRHAVEKDEDRVARLNVTAPVDGTVQGMTLKPGTVIQPGGKLMEVVPSGDTLEAKTRISTRDVGYVKVGDPVSIRVMTYDYSRYGAIPGTVKSVSPTTFLDEKNQPYYEGIITLSKNYAGKDPTQHQLMSGMTVQANIVTGEKSVLSYLLKPIKTTASSSFKER